MLKFYFLYFGFVSLGLSAFPLDFIRKVAEGYSFDDIENHIPKYDDAINYSQTIDDFEEENFLSKNKSTNEILGKHLHNIVENTLPANFTVEPVTLVTNSSENLENVTTLLNKTDTSLEFFEFNFEDNTSGGGNDTTRLPRQELNDTRSDPEFESQEEGSSEENNNAATGLISAFLGGLSTPDGGIDLEAIIGLLGSLSTQNDDGTYDFQGLTDLLRGFLGGGGDDGGGSDIGSFLGGLLGAFIKGVANPPGAKGAGTFAGKVVTGILPALSGPPPADDADMGNGPQTLDSGGFLSGLLKTILSSSSGGNAQGGGGSGSNLFKIIFQLITSVLSSSSSKSK